MNFYKHQDDAKNKTALLVLLLIAAVLTLIVITVIFLSGFLYFFESHATSIGAYQSYQKGFTEHLFNILQSELFLYVAAGVSLLVGSASLFKTMQLKRGGAYVAEALGGKLLLPDQCDTNEKRLLNIIEEMAIASGSPVPQVYILEDQAINAFAAGTNINNAIIGVTRGSVETFSRDQMQGVIAHEFSHIHHGDMRLNMKLLSALYGITMIGLLGQWILRGSFHSRRSRNGQQLVPLGLGLMAIGFGGSFFGSLIRSAVSRQREFLADASAVQYTRNPAGIASALLKIKRHYSGSHLQHSHSTEFSHFFFADGARGFLSNLFASHPPVDTRISKVYPYSLEILEREIEQKETSAEVKNENTASTTTLNTENLAEILVGSAGIISSQSVKKSKDLLSSVPIAVYEATHNAYQARALIYGLLLNQDESTRTQQITYLQQRAHPATFKTFTKLITHLSSCEEQTHFALLQLCLPALRTMSEPQTNLFFDNVEALIKADNRISVKEWAIALATKTVAINALPARRGRSLNDLKKDIYLLLSFFACLNKRDYRESSLIAAHSTLWPNSKLPQGPSVKAPSFVTLNKVIKNIAELRPLDTPKLLKALLTCAKSDDHISSNEHIAIKAIGLYLDTPLPLIDHA